MKTNMKRAGSLRPRWRWKRPRNGRESSLPAPHGEGPPESELAHDKAFLERNGQVVGEAEHFARGRDRNGSGPRCAWMRVPQELPGHVPHLHHRGTGYIQCLPDASPDDPGRHLINRAVVQMREGHFAEAETALREVLPGQRETLGEKHPTIIKLLANLAIALRAQGNFGEMEEVCRELAGCANALALNDLAWNFATSPDPNLRDARWAVKLAEQAVAATDRTNAMYLDTLAAAYAEVGQFTNAISVRKQAIALLEDPKEKEDYKFRLQLFESNTPYRQ